MNSVTTLLHLHPLLDHLQQDQTRQMILYLSEQLQQSKHTYSMDAPISSIIVDSFISYVYGMVLSSSYSSLFHSLST